MSAADAVVAVGCDAHQSAGNVSRRVHSSASTALASAYLACVRGYFAVTGGRNGYGAKLTNVFSTEFIVECNDTARGLKFKQVYRDNMKSVGKAEITRCDAKTDYTCITFVPDLARFRMDSMDADTVALLCKRVYDIAGVWNASAAA